MVLATLDMPPTALILTSRIEFFCQINVNSFAHTSEAVEQCDIRCHLRVYVCLCLISTQMTNPFDINLFENHYKAIFFSTWSTTATVISATTTAATKYVQHTFAYLRASTKCDSYHSVAYTRNWANLILFVEPILQKKISLNNTEIILNYSRKKLLQLMIIIV